MDKIQSYLPCCLKKISFFLLLFVSVAAPAQQVSSDVGNFYPLLDAYAGQHGARLSYLADEGWKNTEKWRKTAKAQLHELLAFDPQPAPLHSEVLSTTRRDGYTQYLVRYNLNALQKTEAFLLVPDNLKKPAPAVIALHDHGGFYFFGKEKHTLTDNQPPILVDYVQNLYEGRYYADELAKRGFVVLCPDVLYFGSQKLDPALLLDSKGYEEKAQDASESERIQLYNRQVAGPNETAMNKTILTAGTTWLGIIAQNDRVAVDYLLSRPEVDPDRIGCIGLSLGGLRSTYLFGLDPRIKTGVVAAFSTTYEHMLRQHAHHTWMMYVPRQAQFLDLPDVASLNAPRPLLVMNCRQDKLFSIAGMQAAEQKLSAVYTKMKAPEKFEAVYYDVPHSMTIQMQEDAFAWLEKWLK